MKKYRILISTLLTLLILIGCNSSTSEDNSICPKCNMPIKSKEYSSYLNKTHFDDLGCLILWAKSENRNADEAMVFTKDTKRYIKATEAYYTINERTPMRYGFTAYEKQLKKSIRFDEVRLRMLRGENMANPKIRKQILGE